MTPNHSDENNIKSNAHKLQSQLVIYDLSLECDYSFLRKPPSKTILVIESCVKQWTNSK